MPHRPTRRGAPLPAIICAAWLAGCGEAPRPVVAPPPAVPADLLAPVAVTCPPVATEADVATCLIRLDAGLDRANAQLAAVAQILQLEPIR